MELMSRLLTRALWTMTLAAVFLPSDALAQSATVAQKPPTTKEEVLTTSLAAVAMGAAGWFARGAATGNCRWCDRGEDGQDTLNGFDRTIRRGLVASGSGADRADTMSDVVEYAALSLPTVLFATSKCCYWTAHDRFQGVRMVLWAMAANTASTSVVRRSFARERPFVHFQNSNVASVTDPNGSFPSGHTSSAFASVFAAARACRLVDCGHERRIWLVGVPLASLTGYLRIAADKHYATDVLAGAGVGATIGWITPRVYNALQGTRRRPTVQPLVSQHELEVSATWAW